MKKTIRFRMTESSVGLSQLTTDTRTFLLATGYIGADQDLDLIKSDKGLTVLVNHGGNEDCARALAMAVAYVCGVIDIMGIGVDYSII